MLKVNRFGIRITALILCALLVAGAALPASAAMPDLELEATGRLAANIYYIPSTWGVVVGCVEDGTALTVIGKSQGFYRINCCGMKVYIAMEQVRQDEHGNYYVNCSEDYELTRVLQVCGTGEAESLRSDVIRIAKSLQGIPYVVNGSTTRGFDCSGFVQYVYRKIGYSINRSAIYQLYNGVAVDPDNLLPGDLVFFKNTVNNGRIATHVGIYIGDGKFIHCANRGVAISSLSSAYYTQHFLCARRVILAGNASYAPIPSTSHPSTRSSDPLGRSFSFGSPGPYLLTSAFENGLPKREGRFHQHAESN